MPGTGNRPLLQRASRRKPLRYGGVVHVFADWASAALMEQLTGPGRNEKSAPGQPDSGCLREQYHQRGLAFLLNITSKKLEYLPKQSHNPPPTPSSPRGSAVDASTFIPRHLHPRGHPRGRDHCARIVKASPPGSARRLVPPGGRQLRIFIVLQKPTPAASRSPNASV